MEKGHSTFNVASYVKSNWFKITLLILLCYIFLQKDMSFEFNLNAPLKEKELEKKESVVPPKKNVADHKTKPITDKIDKVAKSSTTGSGILDKFGFPFIGNEKTKKSRHPEFGEIDDKVIQGYIKRFGHVAMSERKKYGIPASIILANALYHSFAGQRDMTIMGNNHFAIPCTSYWDGESGTYQDACYRHYDNSWASFRDHSLYISSRNFNHLQQLGTTNYNAWAKGLEQAGFSRGNGLARELIGLIEKYELYQYDL